MTEQLYPDVLGMLADKRITVHEALHCALGIFPAGTVLGQPVEALLLLQNLLDQPLKLQITIRTPTHDTRGNLVNLFTPKPRLAITLPGGDCGLVHLPLTPQLPTPPGEGYLARVHVALQKPDKYHQVRSLGVGPRPNLLSVSPFRLSVLREIAFKAEVFEEHELGITFNVLPGYLAPRPDEPMPRYEALWTVRDLEQERARAKEVAGEALRFTKTLTRHNVFTPLIDRTKEVFAGAGMPVHPGEAIFIAKIMTYAMEDGLDLEPGFSLAEGYWFQRLCTLMAGDPDVINNLDQLLSLLYTAVVQDAVLLGFHMVTHTTRIDFGDEQEQLAYQSKLIGALEGRMPASLEYLYVPLILAGVTLTARVTFTRENPWTSMDELKEAREGRVRLAGPGLREAFDILDRLIEKAERNLWELRIPRE